MSTGMRYMEPCKGAYLVNGTYTWDQVYHLILEREAYEAEVSATALDDTLTSADGSFSSTSNTREYILPRTFSNITILDGVSWGNLKLYTKLVGVSTGGATYEFSIYAEISVLARTAAGVDRTIVSTYTTNTVVLLSNVTTGVTVEKTEDFPLRLNFDNQKLLATERLILKIIFYCKYTGNSTIPAGVTLKFGHYHTINTNNLMIQLPIAGN